MADVALDSLTDTWNAGGTTFNAIKMNVTDTASAVASKLLDLQVGGTTKANVTKAGLLTLAGGMTLTGANTIQNTTGDLTLTVGGTGNLLVTYGGTGVKIGSTVAPVTALHISSTSTSSPRGIMSAQYSTGTDGARFHMRKSRGTESSPSIIVTGDTLGRLVASGYDGSNYLEMGSISCEATGTIAATRIPTQLVLSYATDATPSVLTTGAYLTATGNFVIGSANTETGLTGSGGLRISSTTASGTGAGALVVDGGVAFAKGLTFTGANTIQTSSGTFTIATGSGNAGVLVSPNGTGTVGIGALRSGSLFNVETSSDTVANAAIALYNTSGASNKVIGFSAGVIYSGGSPTASSTYNSILNTGAASMGLTVVSGTTELARFTVAGNILIGGTSETGLTGAGGVRITSTTAATTSAGALIIGTQSTPATTVTFGGGKGVIGDTTTATGTAGALLVGTGTRATSVTIGNGKLFVGDATTAAASGVGAFVVGDGVTASSVSIGNGRVYAGTRVISEGNIEAGTSAAVTWSSRAQVSSPGAKLIDFRDSGPTQYASLTSGALSISVPSGSTTMPTGSGTITSNTKFVKTVASIADNTATTALTIVIPNAAHSASVQVRLVGSLGAGGAIGANEATGSITYDIAIARTAGVNAVATISTGYGSATSSVAGAATVTVTGAMSAVSGAVGASNSFTVNVTVARGSGSSANHTCLVVAEVDNANATGVTIS